MNKEIWEPPFIIGRQRAQMWIFIFKSVFVYTRCAKQTLIRIKQVCCVTEFHFGKGKQTHALAVLLKRKYCLRFIMRENFIINCEFDISMFSSKFSTFEIESNRRRDSFPSGHDQRSRCQIFSNVHCLPPSTLLVVYKKTLLSFVFN